MAPRRTKKRQTRKQVQRFKKSLPYVQDDKIVTSPKNRKGEKNET